MKEISSVFTVIEYKTGKEQEIVEEGSGQKTMKLLRAKFPRHTKFVLEGFEIDGEFIPLEIKLTRY
jgi:hypothetical protein